MTKRKYRPTLAVGCIAAGGLHLQVRQLAAALAEPTEQQLQTRVDELLGLLPAPIPGR